MAKISDNKEGWISVYGAREHNLKDVDLKIPRNKLVVFTGLSGSGKSSLAFDTIFAEGQRRYIETFSAYARQFLGGLERPDVDKIDGLSPVISIEQKTVSKSPRSTVGTITEIYDFLRLLFARVGTAYSYNTGEKMVKYSDDQIVQLVLEDYLNEKVLILAPKIKGRKGHYRELFEQLRKQGFSKVRVDGVLIDMTPDMKLDRYKVHDIELVVDRLEVNESSQKRLYDAILLGMKHGDKEIIIMKHEDNSVRYFSRLLMCPSTGISYKEPEPSLFSFNSPYGACPCCNGLGEVSEVDLEKVIPNPNLSIKKGGIVPLGDYKKNWTFELIDRYLESEGFALTTPIKNIPAEVISVLMNGNEDFELNKKSATRFEGIINIISKVSTDTSQKMSQWAQSFMNKVICPECLGTRLKKEAHYFKINDKHIGDLAQMDLQDLAVWFSDIPQKLTKSEMEVAKEILKEITARLNFILEVGLNYLTLHRSSKTLSGGEAQRIRLATQIGAELMNVLYILDEPSIGLHQRDNDRLINSLKRLRDTGNSLIIVEHDREMIESADFIVDIGPRAGVNGGRIVNAGTRAELNTEESFTTKFLNKELEIAIPKKRRKGNGTFLKLSGATGHNLKNVSIKIPLGAFTCVTGVSGSGKSSLINQTLYPILNAHIYKALQKPLPYEKFEGLDLIDKVIEVDQAPIGRTPRSNPATYTQVFTEIRTLYAALPESQIRGYKPGRFSFNVSGGRCETCGGAGVKVVEMNFLPDVHVKCDTCQGKRYNRETLEVRFKGKSIGDVLDMTLEEALPFFDKIPKIHRYIQTLNSVGLGYVKLGQPSTTLSGGEAQRIKLATELAKKATGKSIYILDEPSTGLHFEDIRVLLEVLDRLVEEGNTVLVIEHNLDIAKVADHIIDIGPEGGNGGGNVVFEGTPEKMITKALDKSITAKYLKIEMEL